MHRGQAKAINCSAFGSDGANSDPDEQRRPVVQSGSAQELPPAEIALGNRRSALLITWQGGEGVRLDAPVLRAGCRCADCTAARRHGRTIATVESISIATMRPVGRYAVNLGFSDGHARGIYPWSLLRELAA
jgi:DUF971 family protein